MNTERLAGQAGSLTTSEVYEAFERAYRAWRDRLCDATIDGLPVADWTPDRLIQALLDEGILLSEESGGSARK